MLNDVINQSIKYHKGEQATGGHGVLGLVVIGQRRAALDGSESRCLVWPWAREN